MKIKEKMSAIFILLRPYSLPGLFLLYYTAKVLITKSLNLNVKFIFAFLPVFFAWAFMTLLLEAKHKHSNREKIPYLYPAVLLVLMILSAFIINGLDTLLPIAFFLLFTYLYIQKNTNRLFGETSFIMRGLMETSLYFIAIFLLSNSHIQTLELLFGLVIFLVTTARNLIGDIRDTKFDKMTFSVNFGNKVSYLVAIFLYSISSFVLFIMTSSIGVILPILLMIAILFIVENGYMLHRVAVLLSTIIMAMFILSISSNNSIIILTNVIFLSILSNLVLYGLVPRKSNPNDVQTVFGVSSWINLIRKLSKNKIIKHPNYKSSYK